MLNYHTFVFSWTTLNIGRIHSKLITYSASKTFCNDILHRFWEDRILSFHSISCDDLQWTLRRAFGAWEYNSQGIKFRFVNEDTSDIRIEVNDLKKGLLGIATNYHHTDGRIVRSTITIDDSSCWYIDNAFCHVIKTNDKSLVKSIFFVLWLSTLGLLLVYNVYRMRGNIREQRFLLMLVTWVSVFVPLVYWSVVSPCTSCHDFNLLMVHEIGHALGFGHSDENNNICGCETQYPCENDYYSILSSTLQLRSDACLSQSDADGFHHFYNESCSSVVCFPSAPQSYMGYARIISSLLFPLILSSAVSFFLHLIRDRYTTTTASTPKNETP